MSNSKKKEDNEELVTVPYVKPKQKTNFREVYSKHETYEEEKKRLIETLKSWDNKILTICDVILQKHKIYMKNYELISSSNKYYGEEKGKIVPFEVSWTRGRQLVLKLCYPWKDKYKQRIISIIASKICLYITYSRQLRGERDKAWMAYRLCCKNGGNLFDKDKWQHMAFCFGTIAINCGLSDDSQILDYLIEFTSS